MNTDNRTNEPNQNETKSGQDFGFTGAQVEAAAKALRADEGFMAEVHSALEVSWSEYIARLVLVAAQGATTEELAKIKPLFENLSREYPNECNKRVKAEAERDAALEAIERVRVLHPVAYSGNSRSRNAFCATCTTMWPCATLAALDGAPEPEVKP